MQAHKYWNCKIVVLKHWFATFDDGLNVVRSINDLGYINYCCSLSTFWDLTVGGKGFWIYIVFDEDKTGLIDTFTTQYGYEKTNDKDLMQMLMFNLLGYYNAIYGKASVEDLLKQKLEAEKVN